jgi:hypothetical protein
MQKSQPAIYSVCVVMLLLFASTRAIAADIDVKHLDNGSTQIAIEGEFELSDVDTFRTKVESLSTARVTVAFRSEGGRLVAGIRIGALIREKKFNTVVPDGASCASACALAWLGGTRRFVGQDSSVGFHAAYILKSHGPTPSGSGNAVLGAYLNQLGLSEKAILYITQTAPTSIQWMSLEDAAEHGIAVALLSPQHAAPGANAAGIAENLESPEQRASEVVRLLVARSSGPSAEVLPSLEGLYGERVLYYGRSTSRQAVLRSKHRVADRWTERAYTIRSLSATCDGAGRTCRVKGVMSWKYYDANTTSRSRGVASFEYRVVLADEAPQIVAETRAVHERPPVAASPLKKARRDFRQLLAKVSKLIP